LIGCAFAALALFLLVQSSLALAADYHAKYGRSSTARELTLHRTRPDRRRVHARYIAGTPEVNQAS
jgi:hypothetical protein